MLKTAHDLASVYANNKPFPHIVLKNIWDNAELSRVADECEIFKNWDEEKKFYGAVGKRSCSTFSKFANYTSSLITYCNSSDFLAFLESLTGETGLIPDPYLFGGGIHSTINQGFLKMHADFNWHHKLKLYRRLNLLIYLNRDWQESWGGDLRLARLTDDGIKVEARIMPTFNKTVIFTTTDHSYHGHPDPMDLPSKRSRNSIALYYYVAQKPKDSSEILRTKTDYRKENGSIIS